MARNKRLMLKWIIILAAIALLAALGALAYRHFVTDRIMDKGCMKNPNYVQQLDGLSYDMAEQAEDLCAPWSSDEGYAVAIDGETLTLSENGGELMRQGILRHLRWHIPHIRHGRRKLRRVRLFRLRPRRSDRLHWQ